MSPQPEIDDQTALQFRQRVLSDTGFCARNLLGWDYDEDADHQKMNVGTGGVRAYGSHQDIVECLDDRTTRYKFIQAPRGSYKSTILQAYIVRQILLNPDVRIMYASATNALVEDKADAIRRSLESENVVRWFGPQKGAPWESTRFTVIGRQQATLQSPTFSGFSMESMPPGGRANIVICDDLINQDWCATPAMVEKSKKQWAMIQPFVAKGGILIVVGTRYGADDLYNDLEVMPMFQAPMGRSIILGAGVTVQKDEKTGTLRLAEAEGGLTFPHMTMDFLNEKFAGMVRGGKYFEFSCQYLNIVPTSTGSIFQRWMFQPIDFKQDMQHLSCYLLTDTAVSKRDEGCYSVLAYVGLDAADNIYVLDVRMGHWDQKTFCDQFFDVLEHWTPLVNHCGEGWEDIALAASFEFSIREYARQKRIRLNTIRTKRLAADSKTMRIQRLHAPMHDRKFYVVNTVPRMFDDLDGKRVLWDREGFLDARTKIKQPDGELVHEFVKFRSSGVKNDLADTIAMILEYEKVSGKLKRYFSYKPSRRPTVNTSLTQTRRADYHAANYSTTAETDWWTKTMRDLNG